MKVLEVLEKSITVFCIMSFGGSMLPALLTGGDPANPDAPGALMYFMAVYVLILALITSRPSLALRIPTASPALSMIVVLTFLSAIWSLYPDATLRRSVAFLFTTLFGLYLALRYTFPEIIRMIATALSILLVMSYVVVFAVPSIGLDAHMHVGAWKGIFWQKNVTGRMMVWLVLCLLWLDWMREGKRWLVRSLLLGALLLIVMSRSGTGLVTSILVASVLFVTSFVRGDIRRFAPGMAFIGAVAVIAAIGGATFWHDILYMLGRDPTLTGRTVLWEHTLHSIQDRFLLGYGYGAYWFGAYGPGSMFIHGWGIDSAHNGWIEVWLDLGLPGVILIAMILGRILIQGFFANRYAANRGEPAWIFTLGCAFLLISISESVFMERHSLNWIVLVIAVTRLVQRSRMLRLHARHMKAQAHAQMQAQAPHPVFASASRAP
ncbi:O-antigen ligase family protein [Azospirillum soli]|uniref:O-antigen ligase family protein n=1 Tax=Azospirillum soli TaxID=1304799 RepID=UPI001AE70EF9|nr:O-antigen ligase family protein [Azospirillum soli]MBP2314930.1 O-antigen ligase [Azospirillum soli]